jgi:hypothetical protein
MKGTTALSMALGGILISLQPDTGVAQSTPVTPGETESSIKELADSTSALSAIEAQVTASANLPQKITPLLNQLRASVRVEENTVQAGRTQEAGRQHDKTFQLLRRIGDLLQQHLAPPTDSVASAEEQANRLKRLDERSEKLQQQAKESGAQVDATKLNKAKDVARERLGKGATKESQLGLLDYVAELQSFEDALLAI